MLSFPIRMARKSLLQNNVYVSTSYPELAKASLKYGAKIIDRPLHLNEDNTSSLEVLRHFATIIEADYYVLLQATYFPFTAELINGCINEIGQYCDLVLSVSKVTGKDRKLFWRKVGGIRDEIKPLFTEWMNGQDFVKNVVVENGACYVFSKRFVKMGFDFTDADKVCSNYYLCNGEYVDVDYMEDLWKARKIMRNFKHE